MANSQTLLIIIKLKDLASKQLKAVGRGIQKFRSGIAVASRALFGLQSAIAAVGLGLLIRSFIAAASEAESYAVRLRVLTGSAKEGNRVFKEMAEYAGSVAFEYKEIMGSATALTGVLEGGSREVGKWMPLIADLAATSGLGIQETTSQIIRMYSAGAASADLFRERGILAMLGFQAGVSVSAKKTREQLIAAFEDPASKFRGAAQLLSKTWVGLMSLLSDAWFQFRVDVAESGVFDFIKAGIGLVIEWIDKLKKAGKGKIFSQAFSDYAIEALTKIAEAAAIVIDIWHGWTMVWDTLKIAFGIFAKYLNAGLLFIIETLDKSMKILGDRMKGIIALIKVLESIGQIPVGLADALKDSLAVNKSLEAMIGSLKNGKQYWDDVAEAAHKSLIEASKEESALTKVQRILGVITKKAEEYRKARLGLGEIQQQIKPREKTASAAAVAKAELTELKAVSATRLQAEKELFDDLEITARKYADTRVEIANQIYAKEVALLKAQAEATSQLDKKKQINAQLVALEQKHVRDLVGIRQELERNTDAAATKKLAQEKTVSDLILQLRESTSDPSSYDAQLASMNARHLEEIELLKKNKAAQGEVEEAYRLQQIEKDKLAMSKRKEVFDGFVNVIGRGLSMLEEHYKDQAERSGDTQSKAAKKYKKIAIASAIIDTMQSAIKAYNSLASIYIVGPALGAAAAAMAIALGYQRINVIKNQTFASGGIVPGVSPHRRADDKTIDVTSGEYVHPVSAVQYYGKGLMNAIRQKLIPKEMFAGFSMAPDPVRLTRRGYQTGGTVAAANRQPPTGEGTGSKQPINITNIIDPQMMGQYTSSKPGQRNIMNVLSQNQFQLKQIVLGE